MTTAPPSAPVLPVAAIAPAPRWGGRFSPVWLIPLLALAAAAYLLYQGLSSRGPLITIELPSGEGIAPGDAVTFRDVRVGEVDSVALSPTLDRVLVRARLARTAAGLAVEGTRFWVVRPEVSLSRVAGLETII